MCVLIILWFIFGILSVIFTWNTWRKNWYDHFHSEYWKDPYETALHILLIISPAFIAGGIVSLIIIMLTSRRKDWSFYFKIPKEKID